MSARRANWANIKSTKARHLVFYACITHKTMLFARVCIRRGTYLRCFRPAQGSWACWRTRHNTRPGAPCLEARTSPCRSRYQSGSDTPPGSDARPCEPDSHSASSYSWTRRPRQHSSTTHCYGTPVEKKRGKYWKCYSGRCDWYFLLKYMYI